MPNKTNRELADMLIRAFNGVKAQGRPAVNEAATAQWHCRYRTDDGLKCFAGQLIPDDKYDPSMEGKTVASPVVALAIGLDDDLRAEKALRECQSEHDSYETWQNSPTVWKRNLSDVVNDELYKLGVEDRVSWE